MEEIIPRQPIRTSKVKVKRPAMPMPMDENLVGVIRLKSLNFERSRKGIPNPGVLYLALTAHESRHLSQVD